MPGFERVTVALRPDWVPVVYSDLTPVLSSSGSQRQACEHMAAWLVAYDALQVARGRGHVTYYQTMGGADASAGTHMCGSAWDMKYTGDAAVMDAREMGAAVWPRLVRYGWTTGDHVHGLISCGDNACNGYQYTAYWNGYNGLGLNGIAAGDPLPKPSKRRTWQEGIAWARAEIDRLNGTTQEESDMKLFRANTGAYYLVTGFNMQSIQPAYVTAATLLAGPAVDVLAADITRMGEICQANRLQAHDGVVTAIAPASTGPLVLTTADVQSIARATRAELIVEKA